MKNRILVVAVSFGVVWAISGCHKPAQKDPQETRMTKAEVLRIAETTAESEGFDTSRYDMTGCHYEYTKKDKTWTVFYELKPPTPPGGHFMVSVDDRTKKATLTRGE